MEYLAEPGGDEINPGTALLQDHERMNVVDEAGCIQQSRDDHEDDESQVASQQATVDDTNDGSTNTKLPGITNVVNDAQPDQTCIMGVPKDTIEEMMGMWSKILLQGLKNESARRHGSEVREDIELGSMKPEASTHPEDPSGVTIVKHSPYIWRGEEVRVMSDAELAMYDERTGRRALEMESAIEWKIFQGEETFGPVPGMVRKRNPLYTMRERHGLGQLQICWNGKRSLACCLCLNLWWMSAE